MRRYYLYMGITTDQLTAAQLEAIEGYVALKAQHDAKSDQAGAAWDRWFNKKIRGQKTSGATSQRLANQANYLSADLDGAASKIYRVMDQLQDEGILPSVYHCDIDQFITEVTGA